MEYVPGESAGTTTTTSALPFFQGKANIELWNCGALPWHWKSLNWSQLAPSYSVWRARGWWDIMLWAWLLLNHSNTFLKNVSILFSVFIFFGCHVAFGMTVPWPGIEPVPPAVEAWSFNHWTAREVPIFCFLKFSFIFRKLRHNNIEHRVSLRCTTCWLDTFIYYNMITIIVITNTSIPSPSYHFFFAAIRGKT